MYFHVDIKYLFLYMRLKVRLNWKTTSKHLIARQNIETGKLIFREEGLATPGKIFPGTRLCHLVTTTIEEGWFSANQSRTIFSVKAKLQKIRHFRLKVAL